MSRDKTRQRFHVELDKFLEDVLRRAPRLEDGECGKIVFELGVVYDEENDDADFDGTIDVSFREGVW